jgi:hypothetical protein
MKHSPKYTNRTQAMINACQAATHAGAMVLIPRAWVDTCPKDERALFVLKERDTETYTIMLK